MATRFVRIDLSRDARDYRPVAVEPGVPVLDPSGANNKILFKWLGGLVADPEWEGESVNFYVRDDHGGRLEDVVCQPATEADLEGPLKNDLEELKQRIAKAHPETSTERAIYRVLAQTFKELTEDENRTDRDSYFYRYRDVQGRWRLVWCWGYQRVDEQPAPAVICTDPDCSMLFVRRPGASPKCPGCEALLAAKPVRKTPWKRIALVGLLLMLIGAAVAYWYLFPNRLIATPETWKGPVGSRVEFQIAKRTLFFTTEDVTRQTVAVAADPSVVRFDRFGLTATAVNPGKTVVRFYLGKLSSSVTVMVGGPQNPKSITIEPQSVELGIGTTAHLKLMGEYEDGTRQELTEAAEWLPQNDGIAYALNGFLEGVGEGKTTVSARYRAGPDDEYLEASANVSVSKIEFQSLEAAINPLPVAVGRASDLRIDAASTSGKKYSVLESSLLKQEVEPPYLATVHGTHIEGGHPGRGTLHATFDDQFSTDLEFDVALGPAIDSLVVTPEQLNMVVGQITDLNVVSPSRAPVGMTSSDPAVVELTGSNRLIARSEGTAQVEVVQGEEKRTVDVSVTTADILSVAIDPARVVVPVDHTANVRMMGRLEGDRKIELAPDLVTCDEKPSPRYADYDARSMQMRGIRPTTPSSPQNLGLRLGDLGAKAPVEVVVAPLRLELTPAGPVDLPLGQRLRLAGWANYSGGHRVGLSADRVEWSNEPGAESKPGLEVNGNRIDALESGGGPLAVWGSYFGRDSNRVELRSVDAGPVTLRLEIDRTLRLSGEPGRVALRGSSPKGDVELVPQLAQFSSSNSKVINIDKRTGAFRAGAVDTANVTATHKASKGPAKLDLHVVDPADARLIFDPDALQLSVNQVARLPLLLEAKVGGKVERAEMTGPGIGYKIGKPEAIRWYPPTIVGMSPAAQFEMSARYLPYLTRPATAQVEVVPEVEPSAIRIVPSEVSLAPGQTMALSLQEQLPGSEAWKEVRPGAVAWEPPAGLIWTPVVGGLRPTVTVPRATSGQFDVFARYGGQRAVCVVTTKDTTLDPADPATRLRLVREPEGEYLPHGMRQRYSIMLEKDGQQEPAAEVQWPGNFENDYVDWQAPVLTARQAGHEQWLEAAVGNRVVRFRTVTIDPTQTGAEPAPRVDLSKGVAFEEFRLEAQHPEGFTQVIRAGETMEMFVGESRHIGTNLAVFEGETNIGAECEVTTSQPSIVSFSPETRTLLGQSRGVSDVTFTWKGKLATVRVEVLPAMKIEGKLVVEPADGTLAPGQVMDMRVYVVTDDGIRLDRTESALLSSASPETVKVVGHQAWALAPGTAQIQASLPGVKETGTATLTVNDEPITGMMVEPSELAMSVGDMARLSILGRAASGTHELFPQDDLKVTATGASPGAIQIVGSRQVDAVAPGQADVSVAWKKLPAQRVAVTVTSNPLTDLTIDPARATIHPGQGLVYQVTGLRGGRRRVLGPEDGVELMVDNPSVAQVVSGTTVAGTNPGRVSVTAQVGGKQATAVLNVTEAGTLATDLPIGVPPGRVVHRHDDGTIWVDGNRYVYRPGRGWVVLGDDVVATDVIGTDVYRPGVDVVDVPRAGVEELRFVPDVLRLPTALPADSPGVPVRVVEVLADGTTGRDVTNDPNLEIDQPQPAGVATFDKASRTFRPVAPGQAHVAARLGTLTASPLLLQTGDAPVDLAGLQVAPDPLTLWPDERGTFHSVEIIPGGGRMPLETPYRVSPEGEQGVVAVEDGKVIRGLAPGVARVVVTAVDPGGTYNGISTTATVEVTAAEQLWIEPAEMTLKVGESTPRIAMMARGADGMAFEVPATLQSGDPAILAPDPSYPGRFVAKALGGTQVLATYRGRQAYADVTVTGQRFVDVDTTLTEGEQDFEVNIEVLAAASEGPLEYRVHAAGQTPPATWVPAQVQDEKFRRVLLRSPRLPKGGWSARYHLIIESRTPGGGSVERYPFTFRLRPKIEETTNGQQGRQPTTP